MLGAGLGLTHVPPAVRGSGGAFSGLLDGLGSSSAIALSTRRLKASATRAIKVQRSSDSTNQDIGFVVGAGNGFVRTWYDQNGTNHAVQTTQANMPLIVSAGSLITRNSKPAILFAAPSYLLAGTAFSPTTAFGLFMVDERDTNVANRNIVGCVSNGGISYRIITTHWPDLVKSFVADLGGPGGPLTNAVHTLAAFGDGTGTTTYNDGGANGATGPAYSSSYAAQTWTAATQYIGCEQNGAGGQTDYFYGGMHEVIGFNVNPASGDRTTIQSNQKSYFGTP